MLAGGASAGAPGDTASPDEDGVAFVSLAVGPCCHARSHKGSDAQRSLMRGQQSVDTASDDRVAPGSNPKGSS
jgi:hypothetical protein